MAVLDAADNKVFCFVLFLNYKTRCIYKAFVFLNFIDIKIANKSKYIYLSQVKFFFRTKFLKF